ncbi:MAG: LPS assembly protein LptD, partial [Rhodobacteraceae bacterium]|nr:LPS assembly protein LptD [Paracoccaceae bacterium]
VVHDLQEHQLYYDNAQFRFAGLPILWLPRLRMPDPTLNRARGFLLPSFRSSSTLGFGVRLPYFLPIGDNRDLTITPYLTSGGASSVALRYRQAFGSGSIEFNGAWANDNLLAGTPSRGYLFGSGTFALPRGYTMGFQIETASDDAFLLDYDFSDKDRLASGLYLTRTKRDIYFDTRLFQYHSLRGSENNQTSPSLIGDLSFARRFTPALIGGQATLSFDLHDRIRTSKTLTDTNGDGITDGRDMSRATFALDWRTGATLPNGMILGAKAALAADLFSISQDPAYPGTITRLTPTLSVDLRWPWVRAAHKAGGASQTIEPVAQIVYSPASNLFVPNEDSTLVEFDEGNLFSFSRFPGADIR